MINYHIHTERCGHAVGKAEEYVKEAIRLGLKEIGLSDHVPLYFLPVEERDPTYAMASDELPCYIEEVKNLQASYPGIAIKLGIEADYVPGYENKLKEILSTYPFDYVLGSVHYLEGWGFDNPAYIDHYEDGKINIDEVYLQYFQTLQKAAKTGLYDIIAHPDLIKKFNYRPKGSLQKVYEETVKVIKEQKLCVEVNTAGLRVPAKEIYPAREFLEICFSYGVPVTIGTDAHDPKQVGSGLEHAYKLIKEVGYRQAATFSKRNRIMIDI